MIPQDEILGMIGPYSSRGNTDRQPRISSWATFSRPFGTIFPCPNWRGQGWFIICLTCRRHVSSSGWQGKSGDAPRNLLLGSRERRECRNFPTSRKVGRFPSREHRKGRQFPGGLLVNAGNHLRSHTLTRAVPSAQRGLTSVFGMGTGVTLAVYSPANLGVLLVLFLPSVCSDNLNRAVKTHL